MKRQGMRALDFRAPALMGGELTYLRGTRYVNRVVALCFLPAARFVSAEMIERHTQRFEELNATLLIVDSGAHPLHRWWTDEREKPSTRVLTDLCGRLHRYFGVVDAEPLQRCHTFIIDRTGILRLRVSHDFVEHDMTVLRGLILSSQSHGTIESAHHADSTESRIARLSV